MREEFDNTINGFFPEIAKGHPAVFRKVRRDGNAFYGAPQKCACVDKLTHEPDKDTWCNFCHAIGYYWDESLISVYKVVTGSDDQNTQKKQERAFGTVNNVRVAYYLKSTVPITYLDYIIEMWKNEAGTLMRPYRRRAILKPITIIEYRADDGKLEYYKILCQELKVKFLNGVDQ